MGGGSGVGFGCDADSIGVVNGRSCSTAAPSTLGGSPPKEECGCDAGEGASSCDAHLTCARPVASKSGGVTDVKCTVGTCCAPHGVPLKEGFLSGETPEQFAYYIALLLVLRQLIPPLAAVLLDINCQFSKHVRAKYPTQACWATPPLCSTLGGCTRALGTT